MTTRGITLWLLACSLISVAVVAGLFAFSSDLRSKPGSFLRQFRPLPLVEEDTLRLGVNTYYFAGGHGNTVYLGNYTTALHVLKINLASVDTQHINLDLEGIASQKFWAPRVRVDSPFFYFADGATQSIYTGSISDWRGSSWRFANAYYNDIVPLSRNSYVLMTVGKERGENLLAKLTGSLPFYQQNDSALITQVDGRFCTAGMLHVQNGTGDVVYLYSYRNEFMTLDSGLHLKSRWHTIDTTFRASIKVASLDDKTRVIAEPPHLVNKLSCVSDGILYVNSLLLAKNEPEGSLERASVIDLYSLHNGQYRFSFYLYDFNRDTELSQFKVLGDKVAVIYSEHMVVYSIRPELMAELQLFRPKHSIDFNQE